MTQGDAICAALRHVTQNINAATSVTYTASGHSSLRAARERPMSHILSVTPNLATARRMALTWGVHSVLIEHDVTDVDEMVAAASQAAVDEGFAKRGDLIVIAAGMPFGKSGTTNLLRIAEIA